MQWALHPSSDRRFTQCAMGPSSLLWEEVYPVCSGPLIPLQRWGLPSVKWAPHPSWEMRFTQCAVGSSSLFRDEVYQVCSGPVIPPERWSLSILQCAPHPWLCLIDEIYQMCSGPLILDSASKITQCAVGPSSLTCPERWGSPSVQPTHHPSWEMRFT